MLIYLLKVSAVVTIFFTAYQFLFARFTFFNLNRFYLLFALIVSFLIPALTIENRHEITVSKVEPIKTAPYSYEKSAEKDFEDKNAKSEFSLSWEHTLEYTYYLILIALMIRTLFMMGYVRYSLNKWAKSKKGSVVLVEERSKIKNCSFFNKIIIDDALPEEEKAMVIKHESVHVDQWHAFDKSLVNLAACILWFNPIIYFWRNALDHTHEFLADQVTSNFYDKKVYASLLLNLAVPSNTFSTNSFSKLPLKNRIAMMYKNPSPGSKKLIYLLLLPIVGICFMAFINQKEVIIKKQVFLNDTTNPSGLNKLGIKPVSDAIIDSSQNISVSKLFTETNKIAQNQLKDVDIDYTISNGQNQLSLNGEIKNGVINKELILVIDAGHGGKDNPQNGYEGALEKDLNLKAAKILKSEAEKRNIKVILTRNSDHYLSLRDRLPDKNATAFISLHHNAMSEKDTTVPFAGLEVLVSQMNPNIKSSEAFGVNVLSNLNQLDGIEVRRELKDANLLLLRESKIPAIVIELGDMSSRESLAYVSNEVNLRRISNLILDGFVKYTKS